LRVELAAEDTVVALHSMRPKDMQSTLCQLSLPSLRGR